MTVFKHELRQNFKTAMIWTFAIATFLSMYVLIYPSFSSQITQLTEVVRNMGSFTQAFGLTEVSMGTALGFYAVEASLVLSIGGSMFAAVLGISMVAKEESAHTSDFLMTFPRTRTQILREKLAALLFYMFVFELVCFATTILSFSIINEALNLADLARFFLAQFCLHLEIALLSFALSCLTRRLLNGLGIGVTLILYFLTLFSNVSDKVSFIKYISPFSYATSQVILPDRGLDWNLMGLGALYAALALIIGFVFYNKKDLAV